MANVPLVLLALFSTSLLKSVLLVKVAKSSKPANVYVNLDSESLSPEAAPTVPALVLI
jgi:hypothetical protein